MIASLFWINLKRFFKSLKKPLELLGQILLFFVAGFYGFFAGYILNEFESSKTDKLANSQANYFIVLIISFVALITLLRMFRPTYIPQRRFLLKYYPISLFTRYVATVLTDFQKSYFFYLSIFLLTAFVVMKNDKFYFLASAFGALIGAHLLRRLIQYLIDFKLKSAGILASISSILIIFLLFWFIENHDILLVLAPIFLFFAGFFADTQIIENRRQEVVRKKKQTNIYWKMLWNNKKIRTPLIVGFALKLIILSVDLVMVKLEGKQLFDGKFIYWLLVSPTIIFTYVFNNTWGFWRSLWVNFALQSTPFNKIVPIIFRALLLPILADIIITFSIVPFAWSDYVFLFSFYFTNLLFLIAFSFLWSVILPKPINQVIPKKGSTTPWGAFASFIAVGVLSLMTMSDWFYFLIPLFLILAVIAFKVAHDIYSEKKYKLFETLFKE
ncbi:MAG: hypothetical protein WC044_00270 [Crocinitomicaceae bacterium]